MKTLASILVFLICTESYSQNLSFTITNNSGTYTLTCNNPIINLSASSNYSGAVNYSWMGTSTLTGNNVTLTTPGLYTVIAESGTLTASQTISILSNGSQ